MRPRSDYRYVEGEGGQPVIDGAIASSGDGDPETHGEARQPALPR